MLLLPVDGRVNEDLRSGAKLSDRSKLASLLEVHAPQQVGEAGSERNGSLQLGIFRLGLLQNGNVGVGFFPEREKILLSNT